MARNIGWTGGKADPTDLGGQEGGGPTAEPLDLATVNKGTTDNQPNVGENRGAGGTGSTGSASSSSPGKQTGIV